MFAEVAPGTSARRGHFVTGTRWALLLVNAGHCRSAGEGLLEEKRVTRLITLGHMDHVSFREQVRAIPLLVSLVSFPLTTISSSSLPAFPAPRADAPRDLPCCPHGSPVLCQRALLPTISPLRDSRGQEE